MWVWRQLKSVYEYVVLYGGLLFFALICLAWSLPAGLLRHLLPHRMGQRVGRYAIMLVFRIYLFVVSASGLVKLRSHRAGCAAQGTFAGHRHQPSGADRCGAGRFAPAQFRLRAEGQAARQSFAGRRREHGGLCAQRLHRDADARIRRGAARGRAAADLPGRDAHRAVRRSTNSRAVSRWSPRRRACRCRPCSSKPAAPSSASIGRSSTSRIFPLRYKVRLGERFEVQGDAKTFAADLEQYYREQMTQKQP